METVQEAERRGDRVYGLSFHVDYWDRLGWKDPYSQHIFTERQQQYARQFRASTLYTPQAVLNGRWELVGSNRALLTTRLAEALQRPAPVTVGVDVLRDTPDGLALKYDLNGDLTDVVLNVALISTTTVTNVTRGENAGRSLTHSNVVRAFRQVPGQIQGQTTLAMPTGFSRATGAVIAYAQNRQTGAVLGASRVVLR